LILLCGASFGCSAPRVSITDYSVSLLRRELEDQSDRLPADSAEPQEATTVSPRRETAPAPAAEAEQTRSEESQSARLNLGSSGSNSAARLGVRQYDRSGSPGSAANDSDCGDFASSADAQRYFLTSGGPAEDPHDLDPDGDGFACRWGME
jgi:hypothetical protein